VQAFSVAAHVSVIKAIVSLNLYYLDENRWGPTKKKKQSLMKVPSVRVVQREPSVGTSPSVQHSHYAPTNRIWRYVNI